VSSSIVLPAASCCGIVSTESSVGDIVKTSPTKAAMDATAVASTK
jgi:hypothetical protein